MNLALIFLFLVSFKDCQAVRSADEETINPDTFDMNSSEPQMMHLNKIKAGSIMGMVTKFRNDEGDLESKLMVYNMDPVLPPYENVFDDLILQNPIKEQTKEPKDELSFSDEDKDKLEGIHDFFADASNNEVNQTEPVENNSAADDYTQLEPVYTNDVDPGFSFHDDEQLLEHKLSIILENNPDTNQNGASESKNSIPHRDTHVSENLLIGKTKDSDVLQDQTDTEDAQQIQTPDEFYDLVNKTHEFIVIDNVQSRSIDTPIEPDAEISKESLIPSIPTQEPKSQNVSDQDIVDEISFKLEKTDSVDEDVSKLELDMVSTAGADAVVSENLESIPTNFVGLDLEEESLENDQTEGERDSDEGFKPATPSIDTEVDIDFQQRVENVDNDVLKEMESIKDQQIFVEGIKKTGYEDQTEPEATDIFHEFVETTEPRVIRETENQNVILDETIDESEIEIDIKSLQNTAANDEFVSGLDDVDKFFEEVDPPDELDVGASGLSLQDVLVGQGVQIIKTRLIKGIEQLKNLSIQAKVVINRKWTAFKYLLEDHFDISIDDVTLSILESIEGLKEQYEHVYEIVSEKLELIKDNFEGPFETLKAFYDDNLADVVLNVRKMISKVGVLEDEDDVDLDDNSVFKSFKIDDFDTEDMRRRLEESRSKLL